MLARIRSPWLVAVLAFAVPVAFALFTDHIWEDYFITLRASRHLVEGHGLVFNPGERVHTFTSPLGVLLPALFTWLAGPGRELLALWFFRLLDAALLAAAAVLLWRRADTLGLRPLGRAVLFGLIFADAKLADFAINGMETALLVFFLLLFWGELERPAGLRPLRLALAAAGLMWTRPDACILAAAVLLPHFVIRPRADATRRPPWRPLLLGLALGALLYLPWFAWAWWYYGSPVPHTIVAKSVLARSLSLRDLLLVPWRTLLDRSLFVHLFLPTYSLFGGWPDALRWLARAVALFSAFAWLVPVLPAVARRASLALFLGMFYVCSIFLFPWYAPPWTVLAAIAVAFSLDRAAASALRPLASAARIAAALLLAVQLAVLAASAWQMRVQQQLVEHNVRREIGLWLRFAAAPGDTVFLEPLGYIGYYSQLKTYDYPGLSSPEVVAAIRRGDVTYGTLVARLKPTWLVLRPQDVAQPGFASLADYQLVRVWNSRPRLDAIRFLPGRPWLEFDSQFLVYRRTAP